MAKNFRNPNGFGGKISTKIMNIINQKQYKAILENINLEPNNTILDIGFGNGYLIKKLFKKNTSINVYGIEISEDMVKTATKRNKQSINNGKLKLSLENINRTLFDNNIFDKICTINTFYFWDDYGECFSEIKRILKPDGIFLNAIYSKDFLDKIVYSKYGFNKYTINEVENITKNNGMEIIKTIEIKKYSYCIISKNIV